MLKAIGVVVIIAVCTVLGFRLSDKLRVRQRTLAQFCLLIGEASDRIRTGEELLRIFESKEARELVIFDRLVPKIRGNGLNKRDRELLEEFFSMLGMGDAPSQIRRCETYLELLKKREEQAEQQVKAKAALYGKLGFFAGLFIAVMVV